MAFEDDLGIDPSQAQTDTYVLSATGLVSRTFSLWTRKIVQYIVVVGLAGAVLAAISFIVLMLIFAYIGTISTNPFTYIFNIFAFPALPGVTLISVSLVFATISFVINALVTGAGIKFALVDYAGGVAEISPSFSHGKTLNIMIVEIIRSVLITGVLTPALYFMGLAMAGIDITDPFNPIIAPGVMEQMMIAIALLIVGGIFALYMAIRLAPVLAVVVDTDLSAIDSLKKSWELTGGNFLHVFGGVFLIGFVLAIIGAAVGMALFFSTYYAVIQTIITALLFNALNLIFAVVLYRDLSARKGDTESSLDSLLVGEY